MQIILLPFKFFGSEFFMWNKEQLTLLTKMHHYAMTVFVGVALFLILSATLSLGQMDRERFDEIERRATVVQRVIQNEKDIDRHQARLEQVQNQVNGLVLQMAQFNNGIDTLTTNLMWGLRILGGIALVLLGQFATYVFGLKMRREISRIEKRDSTQ